MLVIFFRFIYTKQVGSVKAELYIFDRSLS